MVGWRRARWIMSVAEVVSMAMAKLLVVTFEGDRAMWQDICRWWWVYCFWLESRSLIALRQTERLHEWCPCWERWLVTMLIKGHHVEVGVGVLPSREGRRCYSGLWPWYRYQQWWRCRRGDVVYHEVQQMELMMKAVVTEWAVVMWWTV